MYPQSHEAYPPSAEAYYPDRHGRKGYDRERRAYYGHGRIEIVGVACIFVIPFILSILSALFFYFFRNDQKSSGFAAASVFFGILALGPLVATAVFQCKKGKHVKLLIALSWALSFAMVLVGVMVKFAMNGGYSWVPFGVASLLFLVETGVVQCADFSAGVKFPKGVWMFFHILCACTLASLGYLFINEYRVNDHLHRGHYNHFNRGHYDHDDSPDSPYDHDDSPYAERHFYLYKVFGNIVLDLLAVYPLVLLLARACRLRKHNRKNASRYSGLEIQFGFLVAFSILVFIALFVVAWTTKGRSWAALFVASLCAVAQCVLFYYLYKVGFRRSSHQPEYSPPPYYDDGRDWPYPGADEEHEFDVPRHHRGNRGYGDVGHDVPPQYPDNREYEDAPPRYPGDNYGLVTQFY